MPRIPIYQMTYEHDELSGAGLVFPSEQLESSSQKVFFAIPVLGLITSAYDWFRYFELETFYFPFLQKDKYYELDAKARYPVLNFSVPDTEFEIAFEIDEYYESTLWESFPFRRSRLRTLPYVGRENRLVPYNAGFVTLSPVDLYEMDELYRKHEGIFVGLTPKFGKSYLNEQG